MPASSDTALSIEQLDVRFGKGDEAVHAVRDLSLAVRRGESFGLVGESGSGKSTVLRAVAGLARDRSEEHTSELQTLVRISYAVSCLKKNNHKQVYLT